MIFSLGAMRTQRRNSLLQTPGKRSSFNDRTGAQKVLLKGMSSEKHFSLPGRQKYFPASSPLSIVPTLLL
jgi:hypothetical protein